MSHRKLQKLAQFIMNMRKGRDCNFMGHTIRISLLSVSSLQNHEAAQRLSATLWGCQRAPSDRNPPCFGLIGLQHPTSSRCSHLPAQFQTVAPARGERGRRRIFSLVCRGQSSELRVERKEWAEQGPECDPTQAWGRGTHGWNCAEHCSSGNMLLCTATWK